MMAKSWQKESAIVIAVALILVYALPLAINTFTLSVLLIYGMLGFSLGLIWGFGGILCFGQTAFFGIGAYAYAISAINIGGKYTASNFLYSYSSRVCSLDGRNDVLRSPG